MNGKKVSIREFMAKYGNGVPVSGNDEITVFEGTDMNSVRGYMSETGFSDISSIDGLLGGARGAKLTMSRDTTDYAQRLFGKSFMGKIASVLFKGLGIESIYKKSIGNRLPVAEREHARIYNIGDGNIALIQHKDPGIDHYANKGATGLLEAALYHFGVNDFQYSMREAA